MTRSGVIPLSAGRIGRPTIDDQNHTRHGVDCKRFQAAFNQEWTLSPGVWYRVVNEVISRYKEEH